MPTHQIGFELPRRVIGRPSLQLDASSVVRPFADLAELVNASLEADSELGEQLSERERYQIFEAIEGVEHEAERLKRLISQ